MPLLFFRTHARASAMLAIHLAFGIAGIAGAVAPAAASDADDGEDAHLPGIVVTGTKTEHTEDEAPVPTQVISREQIEQTATGDVESALSEIPDLYIRRNEEFTLGASTVRMQGLDPNKVAIVIDGQRFRGGINGIVDLRDIPITGLEQIEIIRGPASSLYGSDAMAGVINIRTRAGSDELTVEAEAGAGTADKRLFTASTGYHVGPLRYLLSIQRDEVAIAKLYDLGSAQFAGDNADDLQTRDSFRARLDYPGDYHSLRLLADYLEETNPLSTSEDVAGNLAWEWRPPSLWRFDASTGVYHYDRVNNLEGFAEDVDYLDLSVEMRATRALPSFFAADHLLTLGVRGRNETLESPATVIGGEDDFSAPAIDAQAYQASPFAQTETLIGTHWSVVLGASVDAHRYYGVEASPRATVTWRPVQGLSLSATTGRGYRAPDLLQLFDVDVNNVAIIGDRVTGYAIVGNPDLEPETDFGNTLFANYSGVRGVRITADAFYHDLKNAIGNELICTGPDSCIDGVRNPLPDLDGLIFSYQNVAAARSAGANLTLALSPLDWPRARRASAHDLEAVFGVGYLDTENRGDIAGERGNDLPFRPSLRLLPSIGYAHAPTDTSLRIWGEYNARQYSDLANSAAGEIDPYWLWSFKIVQGFGGIAKVLGYGAPPWLSTIGFYVQGDNVFDAEAGDAISLAGPAGLVRKRNFLAGLRFTIGE